MSKVSGLIKRAIKKIIPSNPRVKQQAPPFDIDTITKALGIPLHRHWYLGNSSILVSTSYGFNMIVPGWDLSLTPSILQTGHWESHLSDYLVHLARPGMIAMDVGANIGWFSSLLASRGCDVHAFEPNPMLQDYLRKNVFLTAQGNTPNCSVNQLALSSEKGLVGMRFPHWLIGGAGIHDFDQAIFLDSLQEEQVPIKMSTIDDFCLQRGMPRVDLVKIDVEGYEEKVLLGAQNMIASNPAVAVALEYTRGCYSDSFPEWLFQHFAYAYAPALQQPIFLKDLIAYEKQESWQERGLIDIVFSNKKLAGF